jgi:hypothetical protein
MIFFVECSEQKLNVHLPISHCSCNTFHTSLQTQLGPIVPIYQDHVVATPPLRTHGGCRCVLAQSHSPRSPCERALSSGSLSCPTPPARARHDRRCERTEVRPLLCLNDDTFRQVSSPPLSPSLIPLSCPHHPHTHTQVQGTPSPPPLPPPPRGETHNVCISLHKVCIRCAILSTIVLKKLLKKLLLICSALALPLSMLTHLGPARACPPYSLPVLPRT